MKVLLLSAYDAPSHRYWREGLVRYLADVRVTQLTLPPRYFSWRVRGNSLTWGYSEREVLSADYDLLVATSLVDLSSLRGFVPALARLPTLLYFHENQFAYPVSAAQRPSLEPQMVNLYSALCADRLVFNSHWNRQTFIDGVDDLLRRLPDHVPTGLVDSLVAKSTVLPVPLAEHSVPPRSLRSPVCAAAVDAEARSVPTVFDLVWNHRWEYDKGPAILLAALRACIRRQLPVRVHIVGQQFRRQPAEFDEITTLLAAQPALAGHLGFIADRARYHELLARAHVVLSTALHEFQGLAVLEAMLHGCRPLVPDRLSYPEYIARPFRYPSTPEQPAREGEHIADYLAQTLSAWSDTGAKAGCDPAQAFTWPAIGPRYREEFARTRRDYLRMPPH